MTARELREALFNIRNQQMTVAELRARLFDIQNQDAEIEVSFSMWLKNGVEDNEQYAEQ